MLLQIKFVLSRYILSFSDLVYLKKLDRSIKSEISTYHESKVAGGHPATNLFLRTVVKCSFVVTALRFPNHYKRIDAEKPLFSRF